jgi:hypothetical protein
MLQLDHYCEYRIAGYLIGMLTPLWPLLLALLWKYSWKCYQFSCQNEHIGSSKRLLCVLFPLFWVMTTANQMQPVAGSVNPVSILVLLPLLSVHSYRVPLLLVQLVYCCQSGIVSCIRLFEEWVLHFYQ